MNQQSCHGSCIFLKKDSSKAICVVQVYFLGEGAIARVLISTVVSSTALRKGPWRVWPHHCDRCHARSCTKDICTRL